MVRINGEDLAIPFDPFVPAGKPGLAVSNPPVYVFVPDIRVRGPLLSAASGYPDDAGMPRLFQAYLA